MWILIAAAHREPQDGSFIAAVYRFARWCLAAGGDEARSAAEGSFYEHLPTDELVRRDLPQLLSAEEFEGLKFLFSHHLSGGELDRFLDWFRSARSKTPGV